MCGALEKVYGKAPWSATTKLLWLRYRDPVVIYDGLAWNWLKKNASLHERDGYAGFVQRWTQVYEANRLKVSDACSELSSIGRFTCTPEVSSNEFTRVTNSSWFQYRVFDHALINSEAGVGLPRR